MGNEINGVLSHLCAHIKSPSAPHKIESLGMSREETFCVFETCQSGIRTCNLRLSKQAALTTANEMRWALYIHL